MGELGIKSAKLVPKMAKLSFKMGSKTAELLSQALK